MTLICDHRQDPLRVYFDNAVKNGRVCDFCGDPLALPCIYQRFLNASRELWWHPACALELMAYLGADVKDALGTLNAHAGLQRKKAV